MSLESRSMSEGFEVVLSGDNDAPWLARRAIAGHVPPLPPPVKDDISLLVTELVTNAIRHGGSGPDSPVRLELQRRNGRLRIGVTDAGTEAELAHVANGDSSGGWGLYLVERIAESWGMKLTPSGTCVWFEVAVTHP